MFLNYIIFCLLFVKCNAYKSFTLVVDTTESMQEELEILKMKLPAAIDFQGSNNDIDEYILVTFKDPDVSEPLEFKTPDELITAVNRLTASGGNECPENTLAAIERALQRSKPKSNIFVFTDAYAKDAHKLSNIENLCKNTRSQVVIFSLYYCTTTPLVNIQTYYNVAKACQGAVFSLEDTRDLRQIFKYIKEVIKEEWTDIIAYEPFIDAKKITFSVNSFTKSIILAVSGKYPSVVISPGNNTSSTFKNILDSKHVQVITFLPASPGEYSATISSQSTTSVIFYKKVQLTFQIGFFTEKPRSMKETSYRPIPGRENYILIQVLSPFKAENIIMEVFNDQKNITLELNEMQNDLYLVKTFIEPDKSFCFWIQGYDKITFEKISGSTVTVIPQVTVIDPEWRRPTAEIIDEIPVVVEFGTNATVACKVIGYPRPNVWWEDGNGAILNTSTGAILLEIPVIYISYLNIENATRNYTVYCKCKNSEGEDTKSLDFNVYRPYTFEVLQTPDNQTIEYGNDGKLFCQVSAYPEATIEWYRNDSLITEIEDLEILPEEYALEIKNINLDRAGEYKCKISNIVKTEIYTAYIDISGIEAPEVEMDESEIVLKLGNSTSLKCSVTKGTPAPELTWEFKSENSIDFGPLPESIEVLDNELTILSAQDEHNGVFKCIANNIEGEDSAEIRIVVQSPPKILSGESRTVSVKEEEEVVLPCYVSGSPKPTVRWEMSQDDVILVFDERHKTDDANTHRFKALWKDSGNYHCIAKNIIGTSEITITVNVLVKPYIEPPRSDSLTVRAGDAVSLACNVSYGNPVPTTKWEFTPRNSATRLLKRNDSSRDLYLPHVRHSDEGLYVCVANNDVGTDTIKTYVHVQ